ncbi:unnamed protein product [Mesocestoides corti]|uniref:Coiled-coil domain-containing protein 39 n=2 Tax=Mesocestoides corti TaxID=53468 RepID=A0A158QUV1_MESCO|nr:unnamed protein product [Mesocestoides corti]
MEAAMIKEVLLETGWQSSFSFPTASKENIQLLELVSFLHLTETKAKICETTEELEMYVEKNKKLSDHICLVKNERNLTERLKVEVDKEIADLEHSIKMAEQENWRTMNDHKKLINLKKKLTSGLGALEDEIFLKSNELTSIKTELDCDQKLVEQFLTDCEMDYALKKRLQSIDKTDNTLIQFLFSEENKLNDKRNDLLKKLDTVVSKNEVVQLRIDTTAEMGREENRNRQEMLQLWEKTVKQLSDRDADFVKLGKDYDELLSDIKERRAKLHAFEKLLGSIGQDIKDAKNRFSQMNKTASNVRQMISQESNDVIAVESEVRMPTVAQELRQVRATNNHLKESNARLSDNLHMMEDTVGVVLRKLENLKRENFSAEEMLSMVEEELEAELQCQNKINKRLSKLKTLRFTISEEKKNVESDSKTMQALIAGCQARIRVADCEIQMSQAEMDKLDNLIYKSSLAANLLERRIARMETQNTYDEEGAALEKKVKHMQEQYDSQCKCTQTLSSMIEQYMNEKRVLQLQSDKLRAELRKGTSEMDGLKVNLANTERSLEGAIRCRNELLVFYNLSRYQLRRAEARYKMTEEITLNAEIQARTISALTRELEEEASARNYHIEMEMRQTNLDRSRVKSDLAKRQCRLEQLKSRYDIEISIISADGDIEAAPTQVIVKSLEEHSELKAKGDELDRVVKKAEEELRALENTVLVMNSLNESARSYNGTSLDSGEMKNKMVLSEKLDALSVKMKVSREKRRVLRASVLRFTVEISSLDEEIVQLEKTVASHEADVFRIKGKNEELDSKLERALKVQTLAKTKAARVKQHVDLDIEVQLLCDFNESVNLLLVRSIRASPFTNDQILNKAHELSKSYQLTTPILIGSADNTKASDRALDRNINVNASRPGPVNRVPAKALQLDADGMFGAIRSQAIAVEKTASRLVGSRGGTNQSLKSGVAKPQKVDLRSPSVASSTTISIHSIR